MIRSFYMFMCQIAKDQMLIAVIIAPLLAGAFFRFGIPAVEEILCEYFGADSILKGYYRLFDLLLSILTPYMICFASAMVMLTEYDENLASYLAVTPVGKPGYIISRLCFPAGIAFLLSVVLMLCFSLTAWSVSILLPVCLMSGLSSVCVALLLFSYSHNRVEGMALAKLAGLFMLGLPVPFFLKGMAQYLFFPLPTLWIARFSLKGNIIFALAALAVSAVWAAVLYKRFIRKLN